MGLTLHVQQAADDRETARLMELARLCLQRDEPDLDFDVIVRLAAAVFEVPVALVSIVGEHRLWQPTTNGNAFPEAPRIASFCTCAIETPDRVFIVRDTLLDARFAHHPLVVGEPYARFYAGAPLISRHGFALGTLCVLDRKPRDLSAEQCLLFQRLAAATVSLIERNAEAAPRGGPGSIPISAKALFECDPSVRVVRWSAAARELLGYDAAQVVGRPPAFIAEPDRTRFASDCMAVLRGGSDASRVCRLQPRSGPLFQATLTTTRLNDAVGRVGGITSIEPLGGRGAIERRFAMFESVVVNAVDAVMIIESLPTEGLTARIVYVNDALCRMTGYDAAELVGQPPQILEGAATDPLASRQIADALTSGASLVTELVNYRNDGSPFWVQSTVSPVAGSSGSGAYFLAVQRDVTERRALERYERNRSVVLEAAIRNEPLKTQLDRVIALLEEVVPESMGTVMLVDGDHITLGAAATRLAPDFLRAVARIPIGRGSGICGTAVFERAPIICSDATVDERCSAWRELAVSAGIRSCWSMPCFGASGEVIAAFALYTRRVADPTAQQLELLTETARFVSLVLDRHRDRTRLEWLASRDALTDLPNRRSAEEHIETTLARARENGSIVGIGVLDVNGFKTINDAFGLRIGDGVLRSLGRRLTLALGEHEFVARAGGDAFYLVLAELSSEAEGIAAATRLTQTLGAAFDVGGFEIFVRPALGLAFWPATAELTTDLLIAADAANGLAKQRGRVLQLAVPTTPAAAIKRLDLEHDLRFALERGELELFYQLVFDFDGRPAGAEALLRWNHPQFGLIEPTEFIPLAEANGTIVPIGAWVIDAAVRAARRWHGTGRDAFVTVNVSARQFDEPELVDTVTAALSKSGLAPHQLHLELTESLIMRNPAAAAATLLELRALGVKIMIDDFGTGYSSLAYLQRFAFDALKIDRAFVRGIGDINLTERSEQIVAAVVQFGRALRVTTVAEGVENARQYDFVRACGCALVQGFLCAQPRPEALVDWRRLQWTHAR